MESKFPKTCSCGRTFPDLANYLRNTTHLGEPVSYDEPNHPLRRMPKGTMSFANCTCGTTLTINSKGMPWLTLVRCMLWARRESRRRGITISPLLAHLRDEVDRQVLAEHAKTG